MKIGSFNITGINTISKIQQLATWLQKNRYDIMRLQETKSNTNDVEKGDAWGKYVIFYSTSTNQKVREQQEKRREAKAVL